MDKKRFLDRLEKLVNIDSGSRTTEGISRVAEELKTLYEEMGLSVESKEFDPELGPCLEVRNKPDDSDIDILFLGHMDTVFPPGTASERPYREEGGRAYGPGVADMKSGDLLIVEIMERLVSEGSKLNIAICHNSDEEIGSIGANGWLREMGKKSKYCFDFEPGREGGAFVTRRKGVAVVHVNMKGISAHAGRNPELGASAILEMSRWVDHFAKPGFLPDDVTVNFGLMKGGTAFNVIPEFAEAGVDIRFFSTEGQDFVLNEMERLSKNPFDPRVEVKLDIYKGAPPMEEIEGTEYLKGIVMEEAAKLGQSPVFESTGGASDASFVASSGTPAIDGCGPIGGNVHNDKEYLELDSIEGRLDLMMAVLRTLERDFYK